MMISSEVQAIVNKILAETDASGPDDLQVECTHEELSKVIDYINSESEE